MTNILESAEVKSIESIGEGTRVCIDFIDQLDPDEGVLVGNTGNGYILVLSENRITATYPARAFRVNCGAFHQYLFLGDEKTTYLSEVKPGLEVAVIKMGQMRKVAIGRVKVEKRNFVRVICTVEGREISATLQDSDSVHVLTTKEQEKPVIELQPGDHILCYPDQPGRHLGELIDEDISEF
ncbi:3-dehydroquinate synthase [Aquibacillus halophilus]|uniref:3-dehydroquinate synthase n=1 Tax=Aquibacillus halophilus TaxID=930132 RepID=A0A6A8DEG6_9BACI|nr:3-dehydroquinate synthase II [Aquibacillus halophilus]MRH44085.1 3-dehydroquinate synthase [Aquibacillus halophilus]